MVASVWFGTSNAAREIVKERSIYLRERMVNLGLLNYVMSKFMLLALFCVVQCAMLLAIVFFSLGFHGGIVAFGQQLAALVATAIAAVALYLFFAMSPCGALPRAQWCRHRTRLRSRQCCLQQSKQATGRLTSHRRRHRRRIALSTRMALDRCWR